jgi:hypothetical protein
MTLSENDIISGQTDNYYWLECSCESYDLTQFLTEFKSAVLTINLAVISFDSDSFVPTEDEYLRGWIYENEIAYFDNLNQQELEGAICDQYDQWLLFDQPTRFEKFDIYVNYGAFSLSELYDSTELNKSVKSNFWREIASVKPTKFILDGDRFIFGTNNEIELNELKKIMLT